MIAAAFGFILWFGAVWCICALISNGKWRMAFVFLSKFVCISGLVVFGVLCFAWGLHH